MKLSGLTGVAFIYTDSLGKINAASPDAGDYFSFDSDQLKGFYISQFISPQLPVAITDCLYLRMSQGLLFAGTLLLDCKASGKHGPQQAVHIDALPLQPGEKATPYRINLHPAPLSLYRQLLPLYLKLQSLEAKPHKNYLASHQHLQEWAAHKGEDICQAMHRLFKESLFEKKLSAIS